MIKKRFFIAIGLVLVVLSIYLFIEKSVDNRTGTTEGETKDIKELVHDYSMGNFTNHAASISSEQLVVTNSDESKLTYELPENEFFVSIAPYIENTHPCAVHSLTGCRGEMVDEDFIVYIEDTEGNVILDKTLKSQSNGFLDLWLPRDKSFRITITHDDKIAQSEFSTFDDDDTCITTIQLEKQV